MTTSPPAAEAESAAPDATEAAILEAALSVVGERGLKGATTRLIAQRADVNEVTLFRRFGTKTNLIQAAIANRFAAARQEFLGYTGDVEADLVRLALGYQHALEQFGSAARVIIAEVPYDEELAGSIQGPQQFVGAMVAMLSRYQAEGVLRRESPQTLIPAFIGPMMMPYVTRFLTDSTGLLPFEFDAREHVRGFLYGRTGSADVAGEP